MTSLDKPKEELDYSITRSQALPTTTDGVWQVISTPGILAECHPFCSQNLVEKWPGVGSKDKIYYYSGLVLEREFTTWIDGVGYDLKARTEEGLRYRVSWRITPEEDLQSSLSITIKPHSEERVEQYARLLGRYLEQVLQGIEYYIRSGNPVSRNQFGSHRLFSPPVPVEG